MHEASLVDALFDEVRRAIGPRPAAGVRALRVRIGALAGVEPELFKTAFDVLHAEAGMPHATLEIVHEPAEWRCDVCGLEVGAVVCATCDTPARLAAGDALILERVEVDDV